MLSAWLVILTPTVTIAALAAVESWGTLGEWARKHGGEGLAWLAAAMLVTGLCLIPIQALQKPSNRRYLLLAALPIYVVSAVTLAAMAYVYFDGLSCQVPGLCDATDKTVKVTFRDALYFSASAFLGGTDDVLMVRRSGRLIVLAERMVSWFSLGVAITAATSGAQSPRLAGARTSKRAGTASSATG